MNTKTRYWPLRIILLISLVMIIQMILQWNLVGVQVFLTWLAISAWLILEGVLIEMKQEEENKKEAK